MASRLLDRLKRSLFKDGQGLEPEQEAWGRQDGEEFLEDGLEAELEEEECVTERLGGTLCFGGGGVDEGEEGDGLDSDSDFLGESMEEGLSSTDTQSPGGVSPPGSPLQESCSLRGGGAEEGHAPCSRVQTDSLLFEVTDASVVQDATSKYVLQVLQVLQAAGGDRSPAVITRRYSDFQRLHATLRRDHADQMERICFPRKKLRRNFTAETIAKRSRAFEQYLSHLCSLAGLRGALCVRHFFYLSDLQSSQLFIREGCYHDALAPLLNAKRLQVKLGWSGDYDKQAPPPASCQWLFTLVGLSCCFQEVGQLEEARDHCDSALCVLTPPTMTQEGKTCPLPEIDSPHPVLVPLLQAMVRLSWQTGRDKRRWEELLQQGVEQWEVLDNQLSMKEFLVKHNLHESKWQG
ncbi:sorting nexin-21 isoform X2 [Genypterus blacodes]|uniref:sorting nexin-21 isoform X2 n=1 Tax=Genypterus blacodes TaxID=154954 RepID=UPI003F767960